MDEALDGVIKTVIAFFKWEPAAIGRLFSDREDHLGIYYWYDYVVAVSPKKK